MLVKSFRWRCSPSPRGPPEDVREVGIDHQPAVALVEAQVVVPPLRLLGLKPEAAQFSVSGWVRRGGAGTTRPGALKVVGELLVVAHAEEEAVAVLADLGPEVAGALRARRGEVGLDGAEGLAALHALAHELRYGEVKIRIKEGQ
ncbi:hypothetical protein ACMD2_18675 [Ananas comosus]|uniref:Uncharacterized protein n=1 Tax=Ananas comosus TaxID=4615 RepID=A0A199USH5_ANACO|nr:hypothetical protein ACMD2_18675 [Ananas comosus]